jgi:ActR/RegA family two-component response regulator
MLRHALERQDHAVLEARDQPEAVRLLQQAQPAIVLSDLRLPEGDGFGVLRAVKEIDADIPVIVMTAYGSIEDAVAAMKEGAMDFLAKPVDPDHLMLLVSRALEQRRIVTENLLMKEELAVRRGAPQMVGEDPSLRKIFASLQRAAATDATVLLEGESGTGKEVFARSLHALSPRARWTLAGDDRSGGNVQGLSRFDLVRIGQLIAIGLEDLHVLVGVAVELLADLRQRIARLDRVGLPGGCALRAGPCLGRRSDAGIDRHVDQHVRHGRIGRLDGRPQLVLGLFRWRGAAHQQLVVLHVQVLEPDSGLGHRLQGAVVLLFQLAQSIHCGLRVEITGQGAAHRVSPVRLTLFRCYRTGAGARGNSRL